MLFKIKKTSEKWHEKFKKRYKCKILDPDGWDRSNLEYSWHKEKITWEEFQKRMMISSICPYHIKKNKG